MLNGRNNKSNDGLRALKRAFVALLALISMVAIAGMSTNAAYSSYQKGVGSSAAQVSLRSPLVIHATHSDVSASLRSMARVVPPGSAPHRITAIQEIENEVHAFKRPQPAFAPVDTVV